MHTITFSKWRQKCNTRKKEEEEKHRSGKKELQKPQKETRQQQKLALRAGRSSGW